MQATKRRTLTYDYDMIVKACQLLNSITVTGTQQARFVAKLADILDSGQLGEVFEKGDGDNDVLHGKEVQSDKLEE